MNERGFWNDAKTLKLLNAIKKYPSIWTKGSLHYTNKEHRNICWNRIAAELDFPMVLVKQKYNRLCGHYYQILRRNRKSARHQIIWKFFHELDFLLGENSKRQLIKVNNTIDEDDDIWLLYDAESDASVNNKTNSNKKVLWNDKKINKFIEVLRGNPILFEYNSNSYENAWKIVADKFDCTVEQVKLQKKSLTRMFHSEYKKLLEDADYKTTWKHFEALQFLVDYNLLSVQENESTKKTDDELILCESDNYAAANSSLHDNLWNTENVIELIDLVRSKRLIWDENHVNYADKTKQQEAWLEIEKQLNLPSQILTDKFNSLIATYFYERQQIAKNPSHVIGWIYFPYMEFLPLTKQVLMKKHTNDAESASCLTKLVEHEGVSFTKEVQVAGTTDLSAFTDKILKQAQIRHSFKGHQTKPRDEHTIFGEAVANEMRQMSDFKSIQNNFKHKVLKILLEARKATS